MFSKFYDYINIRIPEGVLFYPCSGNDIIEPIKLFGSLVDRMIFADINEIKLPKVNCSRVFINDRLVNHYKTDSDAFFEHGLIEEVHMNTELQSADIGPALARDFNMALGSVRPINRVSSIEYYLKNKNKLRVSIYNNDGFLSLLTLSKISVFFYRGDSKQEEGSGQWWFSPQLFKTLISRLVDGAIIVTDGGTFHPQYEHSSWSPLRDRDNRRDFCCYGSHFEYLGELPYDKGSCGVYKITKASIK